MTLPAARSAILGVDVGTSALKAGLLSPEGEPLAAIVRIPYSLSSPAPGAMEQDPDDWWNALIAACRQLVPGLGKHTRLLAVAIGGQAPTLCAVDAGLRPSTPAISWLDQRPAAEAERLYARLGQPVPVWGSWPAQAAWLAHNRPAAFGRTRWLLGCPDYVVTQLTGQPVSLLAWPAADMQAAEIDLTRVPPLREPGQVVGAVLPSAAEVTRLPAGTPVVAGFVDGIMGVLGSGVQQPGDACINAGTSGTYSLLASPGQGYPVLDMVVVGAATNTSGNALDWYMQRIAPATSDYAPLLEQAAAVPAGASGLLFLPHLAGERAPVRDARARGAWVGLSLDHDRRHLLRSVLEGVAFSLRSVQETLVEPGAPMGELRCVGGQARSDVWNQIKADVLDRPLLVPRVVEGAVVGAAMLGALGVGLYAGRAEAAAAMVHVARRFEPDPRRAALYAELYALYATLYPSLREVSWRLHGLSAATDQPAPLNTCKSQAAARSRPSF
ncbi:MAG TPA: FGGY-family carbohydrate kinase [Chloroflexota bacterium]